MALNFNRCRALILSLLLRLLQSHQPLLLTDGEDGRKSVDYVGSDQCMAQPDHHRINSFGLRFHLRTLFLCEPEGLLICYPGQLDGSSTNSGEHSTLQFRVNNAKDNEVASKCEAKRADYCRANQDQCGAGMPGSSKWHGILLKTTDGGQSTLMKMSISNREIEIGQWDTFWVQFGKKHSLLTSISLPEKRKRLESPPGDTEMRSKFMANAGRGMFLHKYVGLWILSLDVLPTDSQRQLHLFVYRGCQCAVDCWLTKPTDFSDAHFMPPLSMGHNSCPAKHTSANIDLAGLKEDNKLELYMLVDGEGKKMEVELRDRQGGMIWRVAMDEGNSRFQGFDEESRTIQVPLQKGTEMVLEVRFHRYFYDVFEGKGPDTLFQRIWPQQWWEGRILASIDQVHVEGDVQMLAKELLTEGPSTSMESISAPFSSPMAKIVYQNASIQLRGVVGEGAQWIQVNLLHDAREWHKFVGATLLQIHVDFDTGNLSFSTYFDNNWSENVTKPSPFQRGQAFQLDIFVKEHLREATNISASLFLISINSQELEFKPEVNFPVWSLDWMQISGDLQLLMPPNATIPEHPSNEVSIKFSRLLRPGDRICFAGHAGGQFAVNFQHNSPLFSDQLGDTPLQLRFDNDARRLTLNSYTHTGGGWATPSTADSHIGAAGDQFTLEVNVTDTGYNVLVNNNLRSYKWYKHVLPPWTVQFVQLTGDIGQMEMGGGGGCGSLAQLPRWIKQIGPESPLKVGLSISIQGTVKLADPEQDRWNKDQISISFFHGALEWHAEFGQTIFQANFSVDGTSLTMNSYMGGHWLVNNTEQYSYQLNPPLKSGQQLDLKIVVAKANFEVFLGGQGPFLYGHEKQGVPLWAVDYIVVGGAKEEDGEKVLSLSGEIEIG